MIIYVLKSIYFYTSHLYKMNSLLIFISISQKTNFFESRVSEYTLANKTLADDINEMFDFEF